MNKKEFLYVSNLLSLSRFILAPAAAFLILVNDYLIASGIIIFIWVTDILDGFFARKRGEITELGKIIDPVADKVTIAVIAVAVFFSGLLPLYFILIIVIRDILIFSGGLFLKKRTGVILQSNFTGKLTVFIIGFTILLAVLFEGLRREYFSSSRVHIIAYQELLFYLLFFIGIAMSIISLISYFLRLLKQINLNN